MGGAAQRVQPNSTALPGQHRHSLGIGKDAAQQADLARIEARAQEQPAQLAHRGVGRPPLLELDGIEGFG